MPPSSPTPVPHTRSKVERLLLKPWLLWSAVALLVAAPVAALGEGRLRADAFYYLGIGRDLAEGHPYSYALEDYLFPVFHMRPPLFSILFSMAFHLFGASVGSALFVSKLMTLLMIFGVCAVASVLYGKWTGLAAVGILVGSSYLIGYTAHIEIDPAVTGISLAAVWLGLLFLTRASWAVALAAGIAMGLAILTKEIAIMFAPLPIYLFLALREWRSAANVRPLATYLAACASVVLAFMVYYFAATGRVFLVARAFESIGSRFPIGALLVGVSLLLLAVVPAWRYRSRVQIAMRAHSGWLGPAAAVVMAIGSTAVLTVAFGQNSAWVRSPLELLGRLTGFVRWFEQEAVPRYPVFVLVGPASLLWLGYTITKRRTSDLALAWLLVCLLPLALTLSPNAETVRVARYGFPLFAVASILLGRSIILGASLLAQLAGLLFGRQFPGAVPVTAGMLLVFGFTNLMILPTSYDYKGDIQHPLVFNSEAVKKVAHWLDENTPNTAHIGATNRYIAGLDFYADRSGKFARIFSWDGDQTNFAWPINTTTALRRDGSGFKFQDIARDSVTVTDPVFVQYSIWPTFRQRELGLEPPLYYLTVSQEALLNQIEREELDYLVLSTGSAEQNMLSTLPQYFEDHPAFSTVYKTSWTDDAGEREFSIYVLKVDRTKLHAIDYRMEISVLRNLWPILVAQIQATQPQNPAALCDFVQSVSKQPVTFSPPDPADSEWYRMLGESCLSAQNVDLGAYYHYMALRNDPSYAQNAAPLARRLTADHPQSAAAWLLLGNVDALNGAWESARMSLDQASTLAGDEYVRAAAMQAGGRLALAQENFALAADLFASARDRDVFEAKRNQVYAWLADAAAQGGAYEPTAAVDAYVSILLDPLLAQPARQRLAQALGAGLDRLDGDAHEAMAQKLLQAGAPSTAQPIMWALVEHYAGPNGENREGNALLYERLADLATHMNDYDRAEQVYNAALQRWPLDAALRYARGNFLFTHTNKTGQAAEDLAQAIAQAPHDENNYRLLVDVYNKAGRHGELTMLLDLAKKNNPELAWPYQLSGEVLLDTLRAGHGAGANPPHNPVNLPAAP